RDLKPANILMTGDGVPKITDFGLAKIVAECTREGAPGGEPGETSGQPSPQPGLSPRTRSGAIMGTPSYMAPEQAGGKIPAISPAIDIYALGAIFYEMLTGRPPFHADTPLDTVLQVVAEEPLPPRRIAAQTPRDLETICLKCLEKEPSRRYA